jgi:hypothetical protein
MSAHIYTHHITIIYPMAEFNPIEIEKSIKGIDFPADKQAIIDKAEENGAEQEEIDVLRNLPEGEYNNPTEITEALGNVDSAEEEGD